MDKKPTISAVIVTYNGREFIEDCLRTVIEDLAGFDHEIILVDNNSTDGTLKFIEANHSNMTLIKNPSNYGFAKGMNQGIEAAQNDFLWLLNQDIRVTPGTIKGLIRCHQALIENQGLKPGVIGPQLVGFDGNLQKFCRRFPRYRFLLFEVTGLSRFLPRSRFYNGWKMGEFDHLSSRIVDQPMGSAMLVHRDCIDAIDGFDEAFPIYFNDVDFCRRLVEAGFTNYFCVDAMVEHYGGGATGRMKPTMIWQSHLSMIRYFFKWEKRRFGFGRRLIRSPLLLLASITLLISAVPRSVYHLLRKFI